MGAAAEAVAQLQKKAWAMFDLKISGEMVEIPGRKMPPRKFFDTYGGIFAKLPTDANGSEARDEVVRLLSEERPGRGEDQKRDPGLFNANIIAAEETVLYCAVQEIGSHEPLFSSRDELIIFSMDELTDAARAFLEFAGITQEAGDTVRKFRTQS